jgi:lactate dehydrogenase-like 2-hydroxyacid dehydrogenase
MKPEILVLGASPSQSVMDQLEQDFDWHHLWRLAPSEQDAFISGVAGSVRGVVTSGGIGITAERVALLPALEIIAVNGIGVDAVPFDATRPRGIRVTNTPGVLTDDVADLAVTLVLAAARRLPALDRYVRAGDWERKVPLAPSHSLVDNLLAHFAGKPLLTPVA